MTALIWRIAHTGLRGAFIVICTIARLVLSQERGMKYRLLAHYLLGSWKDVYLGELPMHWYPVQDQPDSYVVVVDLERQWLAYGFHWTLPMGDWNKAFGGYYRKGQSCRDLYDWHGYFYNDENDDPFYQHFKTKLPKRINKAITAFVNHGCPSEDGCELASRDDIKIWDGLWPILGGREFVSYWTIPEYEFNNKED